MKPNTFNVHEAKTHLSRLLERVAAGEEIVIAKAGKPVARLATLKPQRQPRRPGSLAGKIWIADDFDRPLPETIAAGFRGEKA
jgi:prevent-host-death family protein